MQPCNSTAQPDYSHHTWTSIDPVAVIALILACAVVIIAICFIAAYALWRLRHRLVSREPARLTYYSHLDTYSASHRRRTNPVMAFDNGGYFHRAMSPSGSQSTRLSARSRKEVNAVAALNVQTVVVESTDPVLATMGDSEPSAKDEEPPSDVYESLTSSESNSNREAIGDCQRQGHVGSCGDVYLEDDYEELPAEYENVSTLERRRQERLYHYDSTCTSADELYYENLPDEAAYYTSPVAYEPPLRSSCSSRTDTTDFESEEKILGAHANVTVISMSELSVDIRSCPDTPLLNRRWHESPHAPDTPCTVNENNGSHPNVASAISYSEPHLSRILDRYHSCLSSREAVDSTGSSGTDPLSRELDKSWEMRTSF